MKCVFLVGAIGAGKSTALGYFKKKGVQVLSADAIVHQLYETDTELIGNIGQKFPDVINTDFKVDRRALASHLLQHPSDVVVLESLVHPKVRKRLSHILQETTTDVVVYEMPIARETTDFSLADAVIVIEASEDVRRHRLTLRGLSHEEASKRMQLHPHPFLPSNKPIYRIKNDGSESALFTQLDSVWNEFFHG